MTSSDRKVVHRIPVRISRKLTESLFMFQFTNQNGGFRRVPFAARMKTNADVVEMDVQTYEPASENYDRERGEEMARAIANGNIISTDMDLDSAAAASSRYFDRVTLTSSKVPHHAQLMTGVFDKGQLVLTPYQKTIQLRPSFSHIDVIDSKTKETRRQLDHQERGDEDRDRDEMEEAGGEEEKATAISVQFKRKESEQILAARLQSVNFLQKQIDEEPFTPLVLHGETSEMSQMQFERLSGVGSSNPNLIKNEIQSHGDYIAMISPSTYIVKGEQCASNLVQGFSADSLSGHSLGDQVRMIFRHLKLVPIYRLKELLSRNPENLHNNTTMLALAGDSGCSEGLLELVKENAVLVSSQFHWVAKSHLLYDSKRDERLIHARNLLLHLLHANGPVTRKAIIDDAKVPTDKISEMLHPIAVLKRGVGWVLRPIPQNQYLPNLDVAQTLVQQQSKVLENLYREALDYFARGGSELKGSGSKGKHRRQSIAKVKAEHAPASSSSSAAAASSSAAVASSVTIPNDPAADDTVSVFLLQLLRTHGVCDLEYLLSSSLSNFKEASSTNNATSTTAIQTKSDLKRILQALPVTILPHECYAANAIGDPAIDTHRQAILQEFQKKSSLKKSEIMAAVGTDLAPNIYQRLMKSIAVTKGSAWVLRPSPIAD